MILTLTVECVSGMYLKESCTRVLEMREEASLYALHEAIQAAVKFDRDHPFRFFLANSSSPGAGKQWLSDGDRWEDVAADFQRIRLREVFPVGRKKLYYIFDFGDAWTFEIRKARHAKEPEKGVKYPRVIKSFGPAPEQYPDWDE